MPDAEMLYRRSVCGPKPFCFLMNTDFRNFTPELVEKYMKRSLAYGMFPGFFSADASTGQYFQNPDLYNRDRPLFKKYIPLCKLIAEAGWKPVTLARSNDPKIYVEKFGENYLTVFNDSKDHCETVIKLYSSIPAKSMDLVSGKEVKWSKGTDGSIEMPIGLDSEDVMLIRLK